MEFQLHAEVVEGRERRCRGTDNTVDGKGVEGQKRNIYHVRVQSDRGDKIPYKRTNAHAVKINIHTVFGASSRA